MLITLTSLGQFGDSLKVQLLKDWKRSKLYTLDYLKTMPGDKFSFRPQDSIRTFAQQMIHLSQATDLSQATVSLIGGSLKFGANFPRENNLFVLKCFFYKKADILDNPIVIGSSSILVKGIG